jgi:hypothetical protein
MSIIVCGINIMNVESELEALKQNLLADTSLRYASLPQIGGLNGLIRQGLQHRTREMRLAVLREWAGEAVYRITGEELTSAKNLTSPIATFLINLLLEPDSTPWRLSNYGRSLIAETEKVILKRWGIEQLQLEIADG